MLEEQIWVVLGEIFDSQQGIGMESLLLEHRAYRLLKRSASWLSVWRLMVEESSMSTGRKESIQIPCE
jgi:hypothetical protein